MLEPLRRRLGPGAVARRARKIARRRRDHGKAPLPPQEPRDREAERATRARIRKLRTDVVRSHFDDAAIAARVIRMLGLPRTVKSRRQRKAA